MFLILKLYFVCFIFNYIISLFLLWPSPPQGQKKLKSKKKETLLFHLCWISWRRLLNSRAGSQSSKASYMPSFSGQSTIWKSFLTSTPVLNGPISKNTPSMISNTLWSWSLFFSVIKPHVKPYFSISLNQDSTLWNSPLKKTRTPEQKSLVTGSEMSSIIPAPQSLSLLLFL